MKKIKVAGIVLLSGISLFVFAQAVHEDLNSSVGNGDAMKYNLNEPNAVNPAKDNSQNFERKGGEIERNNHPENDWSNDYNRIRLEAKK